MALANEFSVESRDPTGNSGLRVLLVCPRCKGALEDCDRGDSLMCPACRLSYPIKNGIPVMIPAEAIPF